MPYCREIVDADPLVPGQIFVSRSRGKECHFPLHWHEALEFDLVLEGTLVGKTPRSVEIVGPGDFLFVNGGTLHETDSKDGKPLEAVTLLLSADLLGAYHPGSEGWQWSFEPGSEPRRKLAERLRECGDLYRTGGTFGKLALSIVLRQIALLVLSEGRRLEGSEQTHQGTRNLGRIKKALRFIEGRYHQEISLASIAAEVGMTPTSFSRFFSTAMGERFSDHLTRVRLYHARQALVTGDNTITTLALDHGFSNVKAFIQAFRTAYGVTPSRYRENWTTNAQGEKRNDNPGAPTGV